MTEPKQVYGKPIFCPTNFKPSRWDISRGLEGQRSLVQKYVQCSELLKSECIPFQCFNQIMARLKMLVHLVSSVL